MKKILALVIVSLGLLVSCGSNGGNPDSLGGEVIIDGSSTVSPVTQAVAEEFREVEPNVGVSIGISGTGGGFKKFTTGELDIANASRAMKDEEKAEAKKNDIEYIQLQVGTDGLTIAVNKENTWAKDITTDELKKIWSEGSTIKTWKDIRPEWPDMELKLYAPAEDSGTYDYFIEEILGKGKIRKDYTPSTDENVLVQGVSGDKGAMGFFGFGYYEENEEKLIALKVNGVEPNPETIQNGTYKPLSRPIYIYVNAKSYAEKPQVKAFVDFYLENVTELVREVGYVALNDYTSEKEKLK